MFDLTAYLAARRRIVDDALDRYLPPPLERPEVLHEAMRYSVFSGGKRIRPILCLAAAESVGARPDRALEPAIAVELLHTYTLIHDDLPCMDDDDLRRGKPTSHKAYGEANAVLAGDALQALAFEVCAGAGAHADRLVRELAIAAGSRGVVGGQVEDLACAGNVITEDQLLFIHAHKTADLFAAAIRMGAIAGGATDAQIENLTEYARGLGLAFQITDDLLDAAEASGAPDEAKLSCLAIWSAEEARLRAEGAVRSATAALAGLPGDTAPLAAIAEFILHRKN